jgi:hypothetical protein
MECEAMVVMMDAQKGGVYQAVILLLSVGQMNPVHRTVTKN